MGLSIGRSREMLAIGAGVLVAGLALGCCIQLVTFAGTSRYSREELEVQGQALSNLNPLDRRVWSRKIRELSVLEESPFVKEMRRNGPHLAANASAGLLWVRLAGWTLMTFVVLYWADLKLGTPVLSVLAWSDFGLIYVILGMACMSRVPIWRRDRTAHA